MMKKLLSAMLSVCMLFLCCIVPVHAETTASGKIMLYGESHADPGCLEKELAAWSDCYADGMRDLFVELPFYVAEYLNLWMHADSDEILEQFYADIEGTDAHAPCVLDFYRRIKADFPETVFHGTDVGHLYYTAGLRYITLLESEGRKDSDEYRLAEEIIGQGITYYTMQAENKSSAFVYRENQMVENFLRVYNELGQKDVMGIYGSAHTGLFSRDITGSVPCMAAQLRNHYGTLVSSNHYGTLVSSTDWTKADIISTDTVTLNGKEYQASFFGIQDISWAEGYLTRTFWRVENAYEDLKDAPRTGNYLPAGNYIMDISAGEVFIVDYTKQDGSLERMYFLSDGSTYDAVGVLNTYQILLNE